MGNINFKEIINLDRDYSNRKRGLLEEEIKDLSNSLAKYGGLFSILLADKLDYPLFQGADMNEVKNYRTTRAEGFESNMTGWFSAQALNIRTTNSNYKNDQMGK